MSPRTRIKICGLSRPEDVTAAVDAGADAVGFVFHPGSPRFVSLAQAAALTGDTAQSRKAYEDFFAIWTDADEDLLILRQAWQEYEAAGEQ